VAFFLAQPSPKGLRVVDVRTMTSAEFDHQSAVDVSLAEHVRPELIAWAWQHVREAKGGQHQRRGDGEQERARRDV